MLTVTIATQISLGIIPIVSLPRASSQSNNRHPSKHYFSTSRLFSFSSKEPYVPVCKVSNNQGESIDGQDIIIMEELSVKPIYMTILTSFCEPPSV